MWLVRDGERRRGRGRRQSTTEREGGVDENGGVDGRVAGALRRVGHTVR